MTAAALAIPPAAEVRRTHLRAVASCRGTEFPAPAAPVAGARRTEAPRTGGLLAALAAGDDAAWRATVARYEGLVRARARSVLRNESDVDEAVQRTWVLLLRNADRIDDVDRLPGWLATTARREALAVVRVQQRETPREEFGETVATEDGDLAAALLDEELRAALDRAVESLPGQQRTLVRALLRGDSSYDDLSRELGMPRGSLGPLRGRAVQALRRQLVPAFA